MMRFCPFCSAENADDAGACQKCGRNLPPLPPRRSGAGVGVGSTIAGLGAEPGLVPGGKQRGRRISQPPPTPTGPPRPRRNRTPSWTAGAAEPDGAPTERHDGSPPPAVRRASDEPSGPVVPEPTLAPPPTRLALSLPGGPTGDPLPSVSPLPEVPESGLFALARYAVGVTRGSWQRRSAVKELNQHIRSDTEALDQILRELGRTVRQLRLDNRVLHGENQAIDQAEARRAQARLECDDLAGHLEEENQRFAEQDSEREKKLSETQAALDRAEQQQANLEGQRRGLRDKRKSIERQLKGYLKSASDREKEAGAQPIGDERQQLRRTAEDLRRKAAELDPERQDVERRLGAMEQPLSQAAAKVEALRGELDSLRRALHDAREGHRHRLTELEGEQVGKNRDVSQAESEVARRLVTLGTLVNLNRIERPEFDELYAHIDQLHQAIATRTRHIERLDYERASVNRPALLRGALVLSLAAVVVITALVLLFALV